LALFTQVATSNVLAIHDVSNIYHVPIIMAEQGVHHIIASALELPLAAAPSLGPWQRLADAVDTASEDVRIALVGKYTGLSDSYLSVLKSLKHASIACKRRLVVDWVDAETLEEPAAGAAREQLDESWTCVKSAHGILVPGGFGDRGVEGKIAAIKYARENKVPFLGVCLGFQCAVIEHARHLMGQTDANSTEFNDRTDNAVVLFMPEVDPTTMGGTMRLGSRKTVLRRPTATVDAAAAPPASASASAEDAAEGPSLAQQLYGLGVSSVMERHRHRYEVNPDRVASLQCHGLKFVGTDDTGTRMEILERSRDEHPFFLGVQFHPEFLSRPLRPSPPFHGLLLAASGMIDEALPLSPVTPDSEWGFTTPKTDSAEKPAAAAAAAASSASA
jgi:CTP synthase